MHAHTVLHQHTYASSHPPLISLKIKKSDMVINSTKQYVSASRCVFAQALSVCALCISMTACLEVVHYLFLRASIRLGGDWGCTIRHILRWVSNLNFQLFLYLTQTHTHTQTRTIFNLYKSVRYARKIGKIMRSCLYDISWLLIFVTLPWSSAFFFFFHLCYSHINQRTQFENPVVEAKKKLAQEAAAAAQNQKGAAPAPGNHPLSHSLTLKFNPIVGKCKKMKNILLQQYITKSHDIRYNQQMHVFEKTQKQPCHKTLQLRGLQKRYLTVIKAQYEKLIPCSVRQTCDTEGTSLKWNIRW